jgi:protocatechuate 3,4-dioxygenase beta subunit
MSFRYGRIRSPKSASFLVSSGSDPDEGEVLTMSGAVRGPDGEAVPNAILHVWHANSKGFYSHFAISPS